MQTDPRPFRYQFQRGYHFFMQRNAGFDSLFKCLPFWVPRYQNFLGLLWPGVSHCLYPFVNTFFENFFIPEAINVPGTKKMAYPLSNLFSRRSNVNSKWNSKRSPIGTA